MMPADVLKQIYRMAGTVHFFPTEDRSVANIAVEAAKFVEDGVRLKWLVDTFINHIGKWEGMREFRAIYCTRFRPIDGIEEWSSIPGFTAGEIEAENNQGVLSPEALSAAEIRAVARIADEVNKLSQNKRIN